MSILDEYLELARESIKTIEEKFQGYPIEWKLAVFDKLVRPYYYFEIEKKQNALQKPNAMATVENNISKNEIKEKIIGIVKIAERLDSQLDREVSDKIEDFIKIKNRKDLDDLSELELSELYKLLNGLLDKYYSLHPEKMPFDVKVEKIKDFVKNKLKQSAKVEPFPKEKKIVVSHIDKNAFEEFRKYLQELNFTRVLEGYDRSQNSVWRLSNDK